MTRSTTDVRRGVEHDGDRPDKWVSVHVRGAEVRVGPAVLALITCVIRLRDRKDLLIGAGVLAVGLVFEAYLGGRITDDGIDALAGLHVPLAMPVLGLAIWLPTRLRAADLSGVATGS